MECRISSLLHLYLMISGKYILLIKNILLAKTWSKCMFELPNIDFNSMFTCAWQNVAEKIEIIARLLPITDCIFIWLHWPIESGLLRLSNWHLKASCPSSFCTVSQLVGEEVPPASESEKGSPSNRLAQLAAFPRCKFSQNLVLKVHMLSFLWHSQWKCRKSCFFLAKQLFLAFLIEDRGPRPRTKDLCQPAQ